MLVLPISLVISLRINLVYLTKSGFSTAWINLVCKCGGCSFKIIWSWTQKWDVKYYTLTFFDRQYIPIIESSIKTEKHTRWLLLLSSIAFFISA